MLDEKHNVLLDCWQLLTSPSNYLVYCLLAAVAIRVIHHLIKAYASSLGDVVGEKPQVFGYWKSLGIGLAGFCKLKEHSDLWLSTAIGFAELASYPVLIAVGEYTFIGGWLLLKTAGQWAGWSNSRTAFNRFLFTNIITITVSFFGLTHYIRKTC